ncbi:MAG: hypothetical protein ACRC42_02775 [Mycoplasma sp.]
MGKRRHKVRELKLTNQREKLWKNKLRKSLKRAKAIESDSATTA